MSHYKLVYQVDINENKKDEKGQPLNLAVQMTKVTHYLRQENVEELRYANELKKIIIKIKDIGYLSFDCPSEAKFNEQVETLFTEGYFVEEGVE